ncbi:hypothetical protein [Nonlabens xylanidelens]|nr:hypothetical protein [Nonlabens xylanidelens]
MKLPYQQEQFKQKEQTNNVTVVSGTTVPEEENGFNTPGTIEGLVYDV